VRSVIVRAVWAGVLVGKPTPTIVQIFFNSSGSLIETDGGQKEGDAHDVLVRTWCVAICLRSNKLVVTTSVWRQGRRTFGAVYATISRCALDRLSGLIERFPRDGSEAPLTIDLSPLVGRRP
jgi:hypothetical protein